LQLGMNVRNMQSGDTTAGRRGKKTTRDISYKFNVTSTHSVKLTARERFLLRLLPEPPACSSQHWKAGQ
jgi:hypothetical protein